MRESHVVPATIHNSHSSGFSCERYGRRRQHERQAKRERGDKCSRGTERRATWQRKIVIKAKYKEETRNSMKNQQQQHSPAIASLDFMTFRLEWLRCVRSVRLIFVLFCGPECGRQSVHSSLRTLENVLCAAWPSLSVDLCVVVFITLLLLYGCVRESLAIFCSRYKCTCNR